MNDCKGNVRDVQIAYIGGGSRGWAWTFMTDLALEPSMSGCIRLYDIDREAAKANASIGNRLSTRPEAVGKWRYETADTLQDALTGAAFVVISIPLILIFLIFRNKLMEGVARGGTKG